MKSTITYSKEDEDLMLVTMTYAFDESSGATLRKRLGAAHYRLYPMDNSKIPVSEFVKMTGQANISKQNEFVIQRYYEISQEYDKNVESAKEHAERYFHRVAEDLKIIP